MKQKKLLIVLGNQLFPIEEILKTGCTDVFMAEDKELCTNFKHHKIKILMFLAAMREFRDNLIQNNFNIIYHCIEDNTFEASYENKLKKVIDENNYSEISFFEVEDHNFSERLTSFLKKEKCAYKIFQSPMFLCSREEFIEFSSNYKSLRMENFYKFMRRKLNILMDNSNKPIGNKWSYDQENRKKIPKSLVIPELPEVSQSKYVKSLEGLINQKFSLHPGNTKNFWMPVTRTESLKWLDNFLIKRFENFGTYEDAILARNNFLFHSALSPMLNMGLITPMEVINRALQLHLSQSIPINSFEGFIRQIIGWREFIRGVYILRGEEQVKLNFWNHNRKLTQDWYDGTTGILPLDDAIKNCRDFGYTHHIPRLMIISNIMNLSGIHPTEIYNWFMEMFVDSDSWVMVPNVYGMGTYADGGLFSTKPYSCGSNYMLKMSDYKKDKWCEIVDGLYWAFIKENRAFFESSHRLSIIPKLLDKMDIKRQETIFGQARKFISEKTLN